MTQVYQMELKLPTASVDKFVNTLTAISEFAVDMTAMDDPKDDCDVVVYSDDEPERWHGLLDVAANAAEIKLAPYEIVPVPDRDWVVESQKATPEIRAGRFFIYGSHYTGPMPSA